MAKDIVNDEIEKVLAAFSEAYSVQKGVDLDDIECVCYQQGKKTIFYFRKKREELKRYGPEIIQD
jgi:hypothetical protein